MRILPVLDVMRGDVVRGVGGRRHEYRPIASRLTASSRPLDVAEVLAEEFACREFYVADLDAILGGDPAWSIYRQLSARGFRLWVDAGVRTMTRACQLSEEKIDSMVVGLETIAGPRELEKMIRAFGERIVFSLDLRDGEPLGNRAAWKDRDADALGAEAIRLGVRRLLVLDLARVGCGEGTGTRALCSRLHAAFPHVEISAGGGVRSRNDLLALTNCGVQVALVASALHDGRLTRTDFAVL